MGLAYQMRDNSELSFEWTMVACFYVLGWHHKKTVKKSHNIFLALMKKRFEKKWPEGYKLRQCKTQFTYPFNGANMYLRIDLAKQFESSNLPDPKSYNWQKLINLASDVESKLRPYSRALGRKTHPLKALSLLPSEIISDQFNKSSPNIVAWLEKTVCPSNCIKIIDLVEHLLGEKPNKININVLRDAAKDWRILVMELSPILSLIKFGLN